MSYEQKSGELMVRATKIMNSGMELVDLFVNKNYLIDLDKCQPVPLDASQKSFSYMSLYEISKIVYDRDENINDKLVSVYSALSNFGSTALLVLFSDADGVKFYLGTRDTNQPNVAKEILQKSLRGNFPGIEIKEQASSQVARLLEGHIPDVYSNMAVSSVSIVPSPRDEDKEHFIQGLEKFIDSMSGEKYTAVFVSSPLSKTDLEAKKRGYEDLYSALSQCAQVNLTYSENDSEAIAKGISDSFSTAINEGISDTTGTNYGTSTSKSRSHNHGSSFGMFGVGHNSGSGRAKTSTTSSGTSTGHTDTRSETETTGKTTSDTTTTTTGSTSTIAVTKQNKTVQALLGRIDEQLERIKSCESYGLWDSACYFIAENPETSLVAANTFKAIVAGEKTSVENSFINLWDNEYENSGKSLMVMDYLRYGMHPRFKYLPEPQNGSYTEQIITPASLISGLELPVLMGFPHKSVSGVTSIYLARKKIFTACNECKCKSLIPTYICPKCGAHHTNLTPGAYGILNRTCECGEKLPTTFFNGRKKLQAICPNCLLEGKTTYLNDRESRPLCVPVVGGRSVGKTAYITAFSKKFVEFVAPQNNLEIEFYNGAKEAIYSEIKADFAHGSTRMTVRPQDITQSSSISFSFFVKHKDLKPERLMHIYDIAGEVFTDNNENEVQRQYEYCQGIIFIIDPFAIPTVRAKYEAMLTPEDRAGIGKADINGIINVFTNKLREVTGLSDRKMSKVPIAIVIGKTDSANLRDEFSDEKIEELEYLNAKTEIHRSDAIDFLCRKFLKENEMESFVNAIEIKFKNNRFFAASAIGHTRDAGAYNPVGVLEPMEWICTKTDKKLASFWVKGKYSKKPISKIIDELEG